MKVVHQCVPALRRCMVTEVRLPLATHTSTKMACGRSVILPSPNRFNSPHTPHVGEPPGLQQQQAMQTLQYTVDQLLLLQDRLQVPSSASANGDAYINDASYDHYGRNC